ncbi:MAG TPA: peptide deformylase [Candidatus Paceibacterota bacterium]|nr:peptide deformylase [Candidatus Paceibacterota bacterium]
MSATKAIVQEGTPVLREIAQPVPETMFGTAELAKIIADMSAALDKEEDGVALAAPQIAVPYRIFIVRMDRTVPPPPEVDNAPTAKAKAIVDVYINPEIVKTSRKRAKADEGCLSVRGVYGTTNRHERVTLKARHLDGSPTMRGAGGLLAQIFEHEVDHLNGILFIDHAENMVEIQRTTESHAA